MVLHPKNRVWCLSGLVTPKLSMKPRAYDLRDSRDEPASNTRYILILLIAWDCLAKTILPNRWVSTC